MIMDHPKEVLFHSADSFYERLFQELDKAKISVFIEAHYFDDKTLGKKVFKKLIELLKKNIKVFIIVDGLSPMSPPILFWKKYFIQNGGNISVFNPRPWVELSFKNLFKINHRTHKKTFIIDDKVAFLGSINIDTRQTTMKHGQDWHEIGVMTTNKEVKTIVDGFWDAWLYTNKYIKKSKLVKFNPYIRINHHRSLRKKYFNDLISKINQAEEKVWIMNPYFVPDRRFLNALIKAKKRNIDIKIIVPQKSDYNFFPFINYLSYKKLIRHEIEIYEFLPRILHAKLLIIDDWKMIGSSNLNSRTQKHDWEIDIVLEEKSSKQELRKRFLQDLNQSKLIGQKKKLSSFGLEAFYGSVLYLLRYWL